MGLMLTVLSAKGEEEQDYTPGSDAREPAGFVTELLNDALKKAASKDNPETTDGTLKYGRNITKYVSVPKLGGYMVGQYKYSNQKGKHNGDGFGVRLVRMYIDGTILRDFDYRLQVEYNKTVHLKDMYLEWKRFKEFKIRAGQYKRPFTFENPYNPLDVGVGDFSQMAKNLSGYSDYTYAEYNGSNGGRDIGLMLHGDLLPVGKDKHRLIHYQAGVFNGQGINVFDANGKKDWMGTLQVQPVKDLYIGVFGWKGSLKANDVSVSRNRWAVGVKYEHEGWTARAEYTHHVGHRISDYQAATDSTEARWNGNARADGWYATVGVPCTPWLKCYVKYDAFRNDATNGTLKSIYSICPNFHLHKNLMFQVQYNYVCDKTAADRHYHELWGQAYIRF